MSVLLREEPRWRVVAEWFVRAGEPGGSGGSQSRFAPVAQSRANRHHCQQLAALLDLDADRLRPLAVDARRHPRAAFGGELPHAHIVREAAQALQRLQQHRQRRPLAERRAADQLGRRFLAEQGRQELLQRRRQVVVGGAGKGGWGVWGVRESAAGRRG